MREASVLHLLRHDIRLGWRDVRSAFRVFGRLGFAALVVVLVAVMHAGGWAALRWLEANREPSGMPALSGGVLFVLLLMIAQSLNGVTRALYGRGDLDLLVSSPISARKLLTVRALAIAVGAAMSAAIFVVPIADVGALTGTPRWLVLLPVLAAGALGATALGLVTAVALFAAIGPRRARLGAQILATFIGGGFMVVLQIERLGTHGAADTGAWSAGLRRWSGWLDLPVEAAAGDVRALLLWCGGAIVVFGVATLALGPLFIRQATAAAATEAVVSVHARSTRRRDRAFRGGVAAALRHKEWRIILRDPWIVSQILLQLLYISPLFLVLWQGSALGRSPALALAPTIVVVCFQLAASLTWLGLSGEDAPDLLSAAPVALAAVRAAKIQAVAGLVVLVVGLPMLWLLWVSPIAALTTAVLAGFAGLAAVALNIWHARPTRRRVFAARHRESKLLALIEMSMSMLLGITAALSVARSPWLLVPLGITGLILLANRPRGAAAAA